MPAVILRDLYLRTFDRLWERIEDVIGHDELVAISDRYKRVAGFDRPSSERR
jgi:hypothetical protein